MARLPEVGALLPGNEETSLVLKRDGSSLLRNSDLEAKVHFLMKGRNFLVEGDSIARN